MSPTTTAQNNLQWYYDTFIRKTKDKTKNSYLNYNGSSFLYRFGEVTS